MPTIFLGYKSMVAHDTTRKKATSSAGKMATSSAGTRATSIALQLIVSSSVG